MKILEEFVEEDLAPACLRACLDLQKVTDNHKELLNSQPRINQSLNDLIDYLEALQFVHLPCVSLARDNSEKFLIANTPKITE